MRVTPQHGAAASRSKFGPEAARQEDAAASRLGTAQHVSAAQQLCSQHTAWVDCRLAALSAVNGGERPAPHGDKEGGRRGGTFV